MRLLSVSRSFCSSVPEMGRYKLSRRGALPDFGRPGDGGHSPQRASQGELAMGSPGRGTEETGQGTLGLGRVAAGAGVAGNGKGMATALGQPVHAVQAASGGVEARGGWVGRWAAWLALKSSAWSRPKSRRRPKRGPVQTAFQLETVRVVRNDLTEADLELVVMKAKRGGDADGTGAKPSGGVAQRPLARLATRLFTSGRAG